MPHIRRPDMLAGWLWGLWGQPGAGRGHGGAAWVTAEHLRPSPRTPTAHHSRLIGRVVTPVNLICSTHSDCGHTHGSQRGYGHSQAARLPTMASQASLNTDKKLFLGLSLTPSCLSRGATSLHAPQLSLHFTSFLFLCLLPLLTTRCGS